MPAFRILQATGALIATILSCHAVQSGLAENPVERGASILTLAVGDAGTLAARLSTEVTRTTLRVPRGVSGVEILSCYGADFVARSGGSSPVAIDPCDGLERGTMILLQADGTDETALRKVMLALLT
jgi:hypothetical protein